MKTKFHLLCIFIVLLCGSLSLAAQEYTAPTLSATPLQVGSAYYIKNTGLNLQIAAGGNWSTQAILAETGLVTSVAINTSTNLYTFTFSTGRTLFRSDATGNVYTDNTTDNQWNVLLKDADSFTYLIQAPASFNGYNASQYLGTMSTTETTNTTAAYLVKYNRDSTTYADYIGWQFLNITLYEARLTLYDALNKAIDTPLDVSSYATIYENSTNPTEVSEAATQLLRAVIDYKIAIATPENPQDLTFLLVNPNFESKFEGWTNDGFVTQTNSNFPQKDGSIYLEAWVTRGTNVPNVSITQQLNLAHGSYILQAAAGNIQQVSSGSTVNNSVTPQTGVHLFANEKTLSVDTLQNYELEFLVLDSEVTIGIKAENATGNWVVCDNFRLLCKGYDLGLVKVELQTLINTANALLIDKMQTAVLTALNAAIANAETALQTTEDALVANAYTVLNGAVADAQVSIAAYVKLQTLIDQAIELYSDGEGKDAITFNTAIQAAQTTVNNLDATLEQIADAYTKLERDIFIYNLQNATGTVPRVTTNAKFARGATAAFGRGTFAGTYLVERGFCWATHPNPTVLDNRSTKNFSNNGTIYHIENLEPSTVYYMRAYAMSKTYAVGYGDVIKVVTIPKGTITYTLNNSVTSAEGHHERIASAMEEAVNYWNNLTSIKGHHLSVNHHAGTPTAEASYGGYMQFGAVTSYQKTGTAMHEMGHTIGVGQHWLWYGPNSPLRATGESGTFLGYRTTELVQFLENNTTSVLTGDKVHMWPYGINGANEDSGSEILYIANSLMHQALGEDGLPPTNSYLAIPVYSFVHNDTAKYYIKNEDEASGRDASYLMEGDSDNLLYKAMTGAEALLNDSAAWYLEFNPVTCYYQIRNVATNKYFTFSSNRIKLAQKTTLGSTENFHLKGSRVTTTIGSRTTAFTTRSFWFLRPASSNSGTCLNINGTATNVTSYNRDNSATKQRWFILSEADVLAFDAAIGVTSINTPSASDVHIYTQDQNLHITNIKQNTDVTVYDVSGRLCTQVNHVTDNYTQILSQGVYLITLKSKNGNEVHKVTVW